MDLRQALAFIVVYKITEKWKTREYWVKKWVDGQNQLGACSTLVKELRLEDTQQFWNFIRTSAVQFEQVLELVKHRIVNTTLQFLHFFEFYKDTRWEIDSVSTFITLIYCV